jgi:hypothetical protein
LESRPATSDQGPLSVGEPPSDPEMQSPWASITFGGGPLCKLLTSRLGGLNSQRAGDGHLGGLEGHDRRVLFSRLHSVNLLEHVSTTPPGRVRRQRLAPTRVLLRNQAMVLTKSGKGRQISMAISRRAGSGRRRRQPPSSAIYTRWHLVCGTKFPVAGVAS